MIIEEEFDADEILRDPGEDLFVEEAVKEEDVVDELDFNGRAVDSFDELTSDLDQASDLWE